MEYCSRRWRSAQLNVEFTSLNPLHSLVLFFVRFPKPGSVKTRLAATVGPAEACRIHRLLAERCFASATAIPNVRVVVGGTGAPIEDFELWLPRAHAYWAQPDGDLGQRLEVLFSRAFAAGAKKVVAIGSDAPLLDATSIKCALDALDDHDVTILPATDGGYVLIGSRQLHPELFHGMPWSSEHLLVRTLDVCARTGLRSFLGPVHQDVDTEADWSLVSAGFPAATLPTDKGDLP